MNVGEEWRGKRETWRGWGEITEDGVKTYTDSNHTKFQHREGEVETLSPTTNQEAICNWSLLGKRKSFFFPQWSPWVNQLHSRSCLMFKGSWPTQNILYVLLSTFSFCFGLVLPYLVFVCYDLWCFGIFFVCVLLGDRNNKVVWVGS